MEQKEKIKKKIEQNIAKFGRLSASSSVLHEYIILIIQEDQ